MKAILMCAGKATRLKPLTEKIPKSLLIIKNKAIIEHTLDSLSGIIKEAVIVVGYLKEKIIEKIGNKYKDISIEYVTQKNICGTGNAVYECKNFFSPSEKFLILNGDDLYDKKDIENLVNNELAILTAEVQDPSKYGVIKKDKDSNLLSIIEKPSFWVVNSINTGCYLLNYDIYDFIKDLKPSQRGEIELTAAVELLSKYNKIKVVSVKKFWIPVNSHSDYDHAKNVFIS